MSQQLFIPFVAQYTCEQLSPTSHMHIATAIGFMGGSYHTRDGMEHMPE